MALRIPKLALRNLRISVKQQCSTLLTSDIPNKRLIVSEILWELINFEFGRYPKNSENLEDVCVLLTKDQCLSAEKIIESKKHKSLQLGDLWLPALGIYGSL